MNITKNPYFKCVTNQDNPYLDTLSFKKVALQSDRLIQSITFQDYLSKIMLTCFYIYKKASNHYSEFYRDILRDVAAYPQEFKCAPEDVEKAFESVFVTDLPAIAQEHKGHSVIEGLDKYAFTLLNYKYCEDVLNLVVRKGDFVDGLLKTAVSIKQLLK